MTSYSNKSDQPVFTLHQQNTVAREFFYEDAPLLTDAQGARITRDEQAQIQKLVQDYPKTTRSDRLSAEEVRVVQNNNIPGGVRQFRFQNPLDDAYGQVAYQRAADVLEAWRDGPNYPVAHAAFYEFPGVNPEGKFCGKEMELAQRLYRIETARFLVTPEKRAALETGMEALRSPQGQIKDLMDDAEETYKSVREAQMAAILSPDRKIGILLENCAERLLQASPAVTRLDEYVTAMEHVAGLRQGEMSPEVRETAEDFGLNPAPTNAATRSFRDPALEINVPEAQKNILYGEAFRGGTEWGVPPSELKVLDQTVEIFTEKYYQGVAKDWLNTVYNGQEEAQFTPTGLNRATMIRIDGKTVAQRMKQEYDQITDSKETYEAWFSQNAKDKTAQYLGDALRNDKAVQVQIFNTMGILQAPVPLHKVNNPDRNYGEVKQRHHFDGAMLDQSKSLFEQYAPYRKPLSDGELGQLEQAKSQRSGPVDQALYIHEENHQPYFKDPVLNTYLQIARQRAEQDLQGINTPVDAALYRKYPGVDPKGKYSGMDMRISQRMERLRAVAATATGATADHLNDFLMAYDSDRGNLGYLKKQVDTASRDLRLYEQGARVCPDPYVSSCMEDYANTKIRENVDFKELSHVITVAEKVAGLNNEPLTREDMETYNRDLRRGFLLDANTPVGNRATHAAPAQVNIDLSQFRNVVQQCQNADPKNWGKGEAAPLDHDPNNSLLNQNRMAHFGSGAAENALDALFRHTENIQGQGNLAPDRGSLVIVDGKTIKERMQEHYNNTSNPTKDFQSWYKQNLNRMSGMMVFSALMQGKAVEAYVPDQKGKLPQQPTTITASGYAVNPAKPVTMNAWERLFSKLGFYKEKTAALAKQEKEQQLLQDARQRLRAGYGAAQNERFRPGTKLVKDMFFGEYLRQNNKADLVALHNEQKADSGFRMNRSGPTSACICLMAAQGHDIRDILDPGKLVREKQLAAQMYMDRARMDPDTRQPAVDKAHRKGDGRWLGSVFFHGTQALRRQMDSLMEGKDLTNAQHRQQLMPLLASVGSVLNDAVQEVEHNKEVTCGHNLAAQQQAKDQNLPRVLSAQELTEQGISRSMETNRFANDFSKVVTVLSEADVARGVMTAPIPSEKARSGLINLVAEPIVMKQLQKEPQKPFSQRLPGAAMVNSLTAKLDNKLVSSVADAITETRLENHGDNNTKWQSHSKAILSGELVKEFKVDTKIQEVTRSVRSWVLNVRQDGTGAMERRELNPKRPEAVSMNVEVSESLMKKLGLQGQRKLTVDDPTVVRAPAQTQVRGRGM